MARQRQQSAGREPAQVVDDPPDLETVRFCEAGSPAPSASVGRCQGLETSDAVSDGRDRRADRDAAASSRCATAGPVPAQVARRARVPDVAQRSTRRAGGDPLLAEPRRRRGNRRVRGRATQGTRGGRQGTSAEAREHRGGRERHETERLRDVGGVDSVQRARVALAVDDAVDEALELSVRVTARPRSRRSNTCGATDGNKALSGGEETKRAAPDRSERESRCEENAMRAGGSARATATQRDRANRPPARTGRSTRTKAGNAVGQQVAAAREASATRRTVEAATRPERPEAQRPGDHRPDTDGQLKRGHGATRRTERPRSRSRSTRGRNRRWWRGRNAGPGAGSTPDG